MRDYRIDILRFIGLSMIILAHVAPPDIIFQLRNFDVPLMVIVSGMSFLLSYKVQEKYSSYLWKRIKRLVFPVWIFLGLYFLALSLIHPSHTDFTAEIMIDSFLLIGGIGYVWIIRVFLLVALVSPFLYLFHLKVKSNKTYFLAIACCLAAYELLRFISEAYSDIPLVKSITMISHYIIPYALLFSIGLRLTTLTNPETTLLSRVNLAIFIICGTLLYLINENFTPTQLYKYPPSIYYLSYALFVSCLLWRYSESIQHYLKKLKLLPFVLFAAQNSIWIYLWHILLVKTIYTDYLIKYFLVFSIASFITYIQVNCVKALLNKHIFSDNINKNIRMLFTG